MKGLRLFSLLLGAGLFLAWAPTATHAKSITVHAGEDIQAAVDAASAGDTVKVEVGEYIYVPAGTVSAAVHITKPLKLLAKSNFKKNQRVVIKPGPGQHHGILVEPANPGDPDIDGLTIKGFTVQGFSNNGIWLRHVQNFKIQGNESIGNLENGIWPTLSANGQVKKNVSYGSQDSALWIEASENVRVFKNELHHSPTGLEITVSNNILAKKNDIHHNTVGVGLYHPNAAGLPPLPTMADWRIEKNHVHDNNEPNSAPPGSMASGLPTGGGILVLGVDGVTVKKNTVENNNFFGISVIDYCVGVDGTDFDCDTNPPVVEPHPDNNLITKNDATGNALDPPPGPFQPFARDLLLVLDSMGEGSGNCFEDNSPTSTTLFIPPTSNQCM